MAEQLQAPLPVGCPLFFLRTPPLPIALACLSILPVHTAAGRLRYTDSLAFGCNRGSVHRNRCRVGSRMRKQQPL